MAFQVLSQKISVDSSHTFTFGGSITAYAVGMSEWQLSYDESKNSHDVQDIGIQLSATPSGSSGIQVRVNGQFKDTGGHAYSTSQSYAVVTVIAWIGTDPSDITLTDLGDAIGNDAQSSPIAINGFASALPEASTALLTGFSASYGDSANHIELFSASVSAITSTASATIGGAIQLYDNNKHSASSPTVNAAYIAAISSAGDGLWTHAVDTAQNSYATWDFGVPLSGAVVLLTGFQVSYGQGTDHQVNDIGAKAGSATVSNGAQANSKVTVSGGLSWMSDLAQVGGQDSQDNNRSSVTAVIVAWAAPANAS